MAKLNKNTTDAARDYCETISEACRRLKIADPIHAVENADDYPALCKAFMVEFSIGWLRGVADATGASVEALWAKHGPRAKVVAPNRKQRVHSFLGGGLTIEEV